MAYKCFISLAVYSWKLFLTMQTRFFFFFELAENDIGQDFHLRVKLLFIWVHLIMFVLYLMTFEVLLQCRENDGNNQSPDRNLLN